ncbi:MAG TPA: hypothetical protein VK020_14805, partial [Microlunatus sp.]|nr:hypothetical protein [Microlunatus sp.]
DLLPLRALFGTPVAWPFPIRPLMLAASLVALLVLAAVCALVVLAVARAARPRRGFAAVLFGTWFAVIIGGWLAGLASSPMVMIAFRYPEQLVPQQILQRVGVGGGWGLYWGWLTGLVCAVIFTAANRAGRGVGTPPVPNP